MKDQPDPLGEGVRDYIDILEGKKPAAEAEIGGEAELTNEQRRRVPYIIALYRMPCTLCKREPPCSKFLPFKSDNPTAPWVVTAVCHFCARDCPDDVLKIRLKDQLREESVWDL